MYAHFLTITVISYLEIDSSRNYCLRWNASKLHLIFDVETEIWWIRRWFLTFETISCHLLVPHIVIVLRVVEVRSHQSWYVAKELIFQSFRKSSARCRLRFIRSSWTVQLSMMQHLRRKSPSGLRQIQTISHWIISRSSLCWHCCALWVDTWFESNGWWENGRTERGIWRT